MCDTCGCGKSDEFHIHEPGQHHNHDHPQGNSHEHNYTHEHEHEHNGHWHTHPHEHATKKVIDLNVDILSENKRLAEWNRGYFEGKKIVSLLKEISKLPGMPIALRRRGLLPYKSIPGQVVILMQR